MERNNRLHFAGTIDCLALLCVEKSKEFGFDSMAYDLVYKGKNPQIHRNVLCIFRSRLFNAPGHWRLERESFNGLRKLLAAVGLDLCITRKIANKSIKECEC